MVEYDYFVVDHSDIADGIWKAELRNHDPAARVMRVRLRLDDTGAIVEAGFESTQPLTASEVKRLPWQTWLTAARASRSMNATGVLTIDTIGPLTSGVRPERKRPGRGGHPREHYLSVALEYVLWSIRGVKNPIERLAEHHQVSRNTVAAWVNRCRKLEMLPPGRLKGAALQAWEAEHDVSSELKALLEEVTPLVIEELGRREHQQDNGQEEGQSES